MALESPISGQKSLHIFSDTDPSNHIISKFGHYKQPFAHKTQKQPILSLSNQFALYFTFLFKKGSKALRRLDFHCPSCYPSDIRNYQHHYRYLASNM